ncbi:MAG: GTPase Era [Flaviaesturariibacter sp.]|nr:GTPase Era [Flaviaesturariibacter sp.]
MAFSFAGMIHSLSFATRSRAAVARRAHNPKVLGSIPSFATLSFRFGSFFYSRARPEKWAPGSSALVIVRCVALVYVRGTGRQAHPWETRSRERYICNIMKVGFVNIFGKPNAGKSTLLNALMGEKLAIVSSKVQTTRHRIKGIVTTDDYQIIFSDTPGIIEPKYKLHEKMMQAVKGSLEDADVGILLVAGNDNLTENDAIFSALRLKVPCIVVLNKTDKCKPEQLAAATAFFESRPYCAKLVPISALKHIHLDTLLSTITGLLPEGEPFFAEDEMTDLSERFFVGEMIREKIFDLFEDEIPYQTTVLVHEFKQKSTLLKIGANIIVQRDTQKAIVIGEGGKMIRKIGSEARKEIEKFVGQKIFLELFVKVRPKWRENDTYLKEYGY